METLLLPFINFVLLVGLLVFLTRKPIKEYVSGRHKTVRQTIFEVRERLMRSQAQYEEFSAKLKAVASEEMAIREQAVREGKQTSDRLIKNAQDRSVVIVSDAQISAKNAASELKTALRVMFVSKVIGRTEEILKDKLTSADSEKFRKEFSSQVGGLDDKGTG